MMYGLLIGCIIAGMYLSWTNAYDARNSYPMEIALARSYARIVGMMLVVIPLCALIGLIIRGC